MDIRNSPITLA